MTAESAALTRSFPVGRKYRCTVTLRRPQPGVAANSVFEWEPDVPKRLTKKETRDYLRGRNAAIAELAERTGLNILVIDV